MPKQLESAPCFPKWKYGEPTNLPPRMIERLALVLAGVDPEVMTQTSMKLPKSNVPRRYSIQELGLTSGIQQISPSQTLLAQHRRILAPYFRLDAVEFEELWQNSKTVAGGQDSTELIKAVHWLKKVSVDEKGSLKKDSDRQAALETPKLAPKILFYVFHTAVRRIQRESHKPPPPLPPQSFANRVLERFRLRSPRVESPIYFPEAILHEAESYLISAIKLGKVLQFASQNERRQRA